MATDKTHHSQIVSTRPDVQFVDEVMRRTPGDSKLIMCIQCGTCGGSCPSGEDMEHSPRQLFALIRAGMQEEVFYSNTPWFCVSCYFCTVRCPQNVKITDLMYTIKSMSIGKDYADHLAAPDLSKTFIDYVESYGRSFEFGLATRHFLKHRLGSMLGTARIGLGMLTKDRLDLTPDHIEDISNFQAILACAKEIEESSR